MEERLVGLSDDQKQRLAALLVCHASGGWHRVAPRIAVLCLGLCGADWPAYVTLEVLDQIEPLCYAEHIRKVFAVVCVKNAWRLKVGRID